MDGLERSMSPLGTRVVSPGETVYIKAMCRAKRIGCSYSGVIDALVQTASSPGGATVVSSLVTMPRFARSRVTVPVRSLTEHAIRIVPRAHIADLFMP